MEDTPVYDIAISLLEEDVKIAEKIQDELPEDLSVFLYTERQEDIAGRDGLELFSGVFRTSRLCIVLYRKDWGETTYTRVEEEAIKDRIRGGDRDFMLLVRFGEVAAMPPWFPNWDQWIEYQAERADGVARATVSKLRELERGGSPWRRVTRRGVEHRPLPVSRYQRHEGGSSITQFVPVEPEVCDGCRESVRFRPLVRVQLWGDEKEIPTDEQFCPPCAQKRKLTVVIPADMDREMAYAPSNPTLKKHVDRLLRSDGRDILRILSSDEELHSFGCRNVGAVITDTQIALTPHNLSRSGSRELVLTYRELEEADALGELKLYGYLKEKTLQFLREQGKGESTSA